MTLKDLAIDHPYYAADHNYYSNEAGCEYETMNDFLKEFTDADIDMNFIYRWDVSEDEETGFYYANVYMIHQRKGIYAPILIKYFDEKNVLAFVELLEKHKKRLLEMWEPIGETK